MCATGATTIEGVALLPESLRDDFPILKELADSGHPLVYLDNAASTQHPRQVIDRMRKVYEHDYANVHRGIHTLSERSTALYEEAREKVRQFIGAAQTSEIIFTSGTTASINLVARSWGDANIQAGDEILATIMEHHSNLVPWQQLCERTGATLRLVPITDDGRLEMDALEEMLSERTKLVAISSVSNVLGTNNPVEKIANLTHDAGAVVLVDAAQSVPHSTTDVQAWGADFVAFSGHKMVGPSGVGVLYGREELLEAMPPFMGGGSMIHRVYEDHFTPAELPAKFEAGTPPIAQAIALGAAIDYLQDIGMETIYRHERTLVSYAHGRLSELAGVQILGPSPVERAGLISFSLDQPHAHDVAQELDTEGIAVRAGHHCTHPLHDRLGLTASTRASFYLYNTPPEVDQFVDAVAAVQKKFRPSGRKRRRK